MSLEKVFEWPVGSGPNPALNQLNGGPVSAAAQLAEAGPQVNTPHNR